MFGASTYLDVVLELVDERLPAYLAGDTVTPRVQVLYGSPEGTTPDRFVAVGPSFDEVTREPRTLPFAGERTSMDETYTVGLIIWSLWRARHDSSAQRKADADAWQLFRQVNAGLRRTADDVSLGGRVTGCWLGSITPSHHKLGEGRATQLFCDLVVQASRV